jgi:signal peptidase I
MEDLQPSPPAATEESAPARSTSSGIKDTIESILVAFILAFVFRAFVVEAFVIPTGSMATTLLGAHTRFHCPDCGYTFDMDYSAPNQQGGLEGEEPEIPSTVDITGSIYCPNCGFAVPEDQKHQAPIAYGDRILVLKYLYLMHPPKRWDVVVFKAPIQTTTNYIKRLIATPGESVMVVDGDVYIKEPGESEFKIQTKPPEVQKALWRLVYDNDFHPQGKDRDLLSAWNQPWTTVDGTGWNLGDPQNASENNGGRLFEFTGTNASSRLRFNADANPTPQSTTDYLAYDALRTGTRSNDTNDSDLDLRCTYQRMSGGGPFSLSLTKRGHVFIAEITPDKATLYHEVNGVRVQVGSPLQITAEDRPMRIELSNADYQVTLRVDDSVVAQTTPADYSPNLNALIAEFAQRVRPPRGSAEINAADQHCKVSHLSLWRDLYYINHDFRQNQDVLRATPRQPVSLGKGEYFVMGDNSAMSLDARLWDTGVDLPAEGIKIDAGKVPEQFMLGKAFFVYWPAGYAPNSMLPALVPNFGAMRFIH